MTRQARQVVRRVVLFVAIAAFGLWLLAVFQYDPWRRERLRAAVAPGAAWQNALVAAEAAAFPSAEQFVAFCMAGDGLAAEFFRSSSSEYRIVEKGVARATDGRSSERVETSAHSFSNREEWARAVAILGEHLRCERLMILFPPTDVLQVACDATGKFVRPSLPALE